MANHYMKIFVIVCISIVVNGKYSLETVNGKIKLTIGTTSGCSDTVNFINKQLSPVYEKYKKFLDIEFVPWGRTKVRNGTLFCAFGEEDCWANRLHRCILKSLKSDQDAQMRYMKCEFSYPYPAFSEGTYNCVEEVGLSKGDVQPCMNSTTDCLARDAQLAAAKPMKLINFVPSIVFNNKIDKKLHLGALMNLKSLICNALAKDPSNNVASCV